MVLPTNTQIYQFMFSHDITIITVPIHTTKLQKIEIIAGIMEHRIEKTIVKHLYK